MSRLISIRSVSARKCGADLTISSECGCSVRIITIKSPYTIFFSSVPAYQINSWLSSVCIASRLGNVREVVPLFFFVCVLIHILSSQHACISSSWLCSVVSTAPKWPYIGLGVHSGALFSRWLILKNLRRNPPNVSPVLEEGSALLRPWESYPLVCLSCWD